MINFLFILAVSVHETFRHMYESPTCSVCDAAPLGFSLDVSFFEGCDDCLRRQLSVERLECRAVWKFLTSFTAHSMSVANYICKTHNVYLSEDLTLGFQAAGYTSDYFYRNKNPSLNSDFIQRLRKDKKWQNDIILQMLGPRPREEAKEQPVDVTLNPYSQLKEEDDVTYDDMVSEIDFSKMAADQLLSIFHLYTNFLDEDQFLALSPALSVNRWACLRENNLDIFEEVKVTVERWVPIGRQECGSNLAKGFDAVMNGNVVNELEESKTLGHIPYIKNIAKMAVSTDCGVTRSVHINDIMIKEEFSVETVLYCNLFFTLWLHCGGFSPIEKKYERRHCQLHGLGRYEGSNEYSTYRQSWIPSSYGLKAAGSLIAQIKPILIGETLVNLALGVLPQMLVDYINSRAVLLSPAFTQLARPVQSLCLQIYKTGDRVPIGLVRKIIGKKMDEAMGLIFSFSDSPKPKPAPKQPAPKTPAKSSSSSVPKKTVKGKKTKKPIPYSDTYSVKQKASFTKAFGGDFGHFLVCKEKVGKGKMDPVYLATLFVDGKPKFKPANREKIAEKARSSLNQ